MMYLFGCMLFIMDGVTVVFLLVFTSHARIYGMKKCCRPCQPNKEVFWVCAFPVCCVWFLSDLGLLYFIDCRGFCDLGLWFFVIRPTPLQLVWCVFLVVVVSCVVGSIL
ncbi:hypothetical protein VNO80_18424 [Phaseolus coccineus]|uniref:Uncharacterized protein n=1 Tax=Phaseolus coccineus TaxID=3886 RepID=A0AAN9MEM8_PHACN